MSKNLSVGDLCIYCFSDTSFGSGNFVNRVPADRVMHELAQDLMHIATPTVLIGVDPDLYDTVDGYICSSCLTYECDACGQPVYEDAEVWDEQETGHWHPACLPKHLWHPDLLEEN